MEWYKNMRTATKIVSAFLIMSLILLSFGLYSISTMRTMDKNLDSMYDINLLPVRDLTATQASFQKLRVLVRDVSTESSEEREQEFNKIIKEERSEVVNKINNFRPRATTPREQELLAQLDPAYEEYNKLYDQALVLAGEDDTTAFNKYLRDVLREQGDKVEEILKSLVDFNIQLADQANTQSEKSFNSALTTTIAVIVGVILLSIFLGYFIARSISKPLLSMVEVARKVADGDLTQSVNISTKDEIGQLGTALGRMVDNLRVLINNIIMNSQSVAASSQEISASTEEIASTSSSQSEAAANIADLFKELSVAINSVASSAEEAAEMSNDTVRTAREGGRIVDDALKGMQSVSGQMDQLENDSRKIGDIIEVIDDIAEQTNLLALNAAIEAARAGEQGRGFAVVADEVRKLAERSSAATKEITNIIKMIQENTKNSVQAVAISVDQSTLTGEAFDKIIEMVNNTSAKVNEIAAACEEEAAQAAEVMLSVESISASSEESAAASEETAATCQSLAQLSEELAVSAGAFKTH